MEQVEQRSSIQVGELQIDSSLQNRRRRRSKNDDSGRDFICQCGKSYLSYSALYTHSKVKHNAKITLEQSLYTSANTPKSHKNNFIDIDLLQALQEQQKQFSFTHLQQVLQMVKRQLKDQFIKTAASKKVKLNNVIFLEKYKKYWENREKDDQMVEDGIYTTTMDRAFGYFLVISEKTIKKDEFLFVQIFLMKLRSDLNDLKNNWRYTETTHAAELPKDMNELFLSKFKINDIFKENPTLTCMLIYLFCRWLSQESFTPYELRLNLAEQP